MSDSLSPSTTASAGSTGLVPTDFAEKAMASVMQLHSELMDEKERRVELYRKLMEREQTVAELRMYVRMLEEQVEATRGQSAIGAPVARPPEKPTEATVPTGSSSARPSPPTAHAANPLQQPPMPPRIDKPRIDGWKTW